MIGRRCTKRSKECWRAASTRFCSQRACRSNIFLKSQRTKGNAKRRSLDCGGRLSARLDQLAAKHCVAVESSPAWSRAIPKWACWCGKRPSFTQKGSTEDETFGGGPAALRGSLGLWAASRRSSCRRRRNDFDRHASAGSPVSAFLGADVRLRARGAEYAGGLPGRFTRSAGYHRLSLCAFPRDSR